MPYAGHEGGGGGVCPEPGPGVKMTSYPPPYPPQIFLYSFLPAANFFEMLPLAMSEKSEAWSRLTAEIADRGEHEVLDMIATRIAEGEKPQNIARSMGYPWYVLRKWMEDSPDRMDAWALAKRCYADGLAYDSVSVARGADVDDISVARLQNDSYMKMAGKLSKQEWGEQKSAVVADGLTIDEALGGFAGMLLAKMRVVESIPEGACEKEVVSEMGPQKILLENVGITYDGDVI